MIRAVVATYAFGLLAFPVWGLVDPDGYRGVLDDFAQADSAELAGLQMAAAIHWLRNAYVAFALLLLARYVGAPARVSDVGRAGWLLAAFPLVMMAHDGLAQIALSVDLENLEISVSLRSDMLLYCILGLSFVGIARTMTTTNEEGEQP